MGRYVPISYIDRRQDNLKYGSGSSKMIYPLYSTYRNIYNYKNLQESLYAWNSYTKSVGKNLDRVMEIFDIISTNGTDKELRESTSIINSYIVPYLESPSMLKKDIVRKLNKNPAQPIKECLESINDTISDITECDRVINNYNTISRRFNIDKVVSSNMVFAEDTIDGIYTLCSLIDTYDMDLKSKFCITSEMALYSVDKYAKWSIPQKTIMDNVIDYYLINYGTSDVDKFIHEIKEASKKDRFIHESSYEYLNYLQDINKRLNENKDDPDEIIKQLRDESVYGLNEDMNQWDIIDKSLQAIYEIAILDKAKAFITKLKMMPVKTISTLKSAIRSLFVTNRAEDIRKGTHNALSLAFYGFITLSAFSLGMLPGILGLITSYAVANKSNKLYLKGAMEEFKDHKYTLQRRIRDCDDPEKKRRMEAYLSDVEKNIDTLEKEYEKQRDRTLDEIKQKDAMKASGDSEGRSDNTPSFISNAIDSISKGVKSFQQYDDEREEKKKQAISNISTSYDPSIDDELADYEEYMRQRRGGK